MWNLFNCYMSGRHDYGMWCEKGAIFLRCVHCGNRSSGWAIDPKPLKATPRATAATSTSVAASCVIPFDQRAAS